MAKKQVSHINTLLNHTKALVTLQDDIKVWRTAHQSLENNVTEIDKYVRRLPTKVYLDRHNKAMDEELHKTQEVSTSLTTHMENYTMSNSTSHGPRSVQVGPIGTQPTTHWTRFVNEEEYKSSSVNTSEDASRYYGRLRGGSGSNPESDNAQVPDPYHPEPPAPPAQPPAPQGPPGPRPGTPGPNPPWDEWRKRKRKADVKPIKLKDPKQFKGKPGDDFKSWRIMLETFI